MKQLLFGLGLLVLPTVAVHACDQCSCASSGFMGIVPQFGRHSVGISYGFQQYRSLHGPDTEAGTTNGSNEEQFHTWELNGSYYPHHRWQLTTAVPYVYRSQWSSANGTYVGHGVGDARLGTVFTALATPDSLGRKVRHHLFVGTELKMPTGRQNLKQNGEELHRNLQPGTGSWDISVHVRYLIRVKRWGASLLADYRKNTPNSDGFMMGDRINLLMGGFYWTTVGEGTFMPQVGIHLDQALPDSRRGHDRANTGGYQLMARADLQFGYKRLLTNLGVALPFAHSLNGSESIPKYQCNISMRILI